jgi:hypothetical protein
MNRSAILLFLSLAILQPCANAQAINWDMTGWQVLTQPLSTLPVPDRQGIAKSLGLKPEELVALQVATPSGHIFLVQGIYRIGGICGANNCAFWILGSDYKVVLEKVTQTFKLQATHHGGLPDIITSMHGSAIDSSLSYWEFKGQRYARVACADVVYGDDDGNDFKKPHISPHPCGTGG